VLKSVQQTTPRRIRRARSRRLLKWAAVGAVACLVAFSLLPIRIHSALHGTPGHLFLHITAFGFTSLVFLLLSVNGAQKWTSLFGLLGLALCIELGQGALFHQHVEWADVLLDLLGALGALALLRLRRVFNQRSFR
jgi:hypothetical protein